MDGALVKGVVGKVPPALAFLVNDPPLVGYEKREDYEKLFSAVVDALKPSDAVVWLLARDFADLTWEILRERTLKVQIIKLAQVDVVCQLLSPSRPSVVGAPAMRPTTRKQMELWTADDEARQKIDAKLAKQGYDASYIRTLASRRIAEEIETIDSRIATYELRRMAVLKAIEQHSVTSARRLSAEIIEGQFSDAAE